MRAEANEPDAHISAAPTQASEPDDGGVAGRVTRAHEERHPGEPDEGGRDAPLRHAVAGDGVA